MNTERRGKSLGMEGHFKAGRKFYFFSWIVGTHGLFDLFNLLLLLFKNIYIWYSFVCTIYLMRSWSKPNGSFTQISLCHWESFKTPAATLFTALTKDGALRTDISARGSSTGPAGDCPEWAGGKEENGEWHVIAWRLCSYKKASGESHIKLRGIWDAVLTNYSGNILSLQAATVLGSWIIHITNKW